MRKNLLVTLLSIICIAVSLNAQIIDDNMESYSLGAIGPQADHWTTWSGNEGNLIEDGFVTETEAASGTKSMYINDGGAVDVLLLLGDKSSGQYELSWNMFVVEGQVGYYNIQDEEVPGIQWNLNVFFGLDATGANMTPGVGEFSVGQDAPLSTFEYPEGEWFEVKHVIDLDTDVLTLFVNGENIYDVPYEGNLGAVDFFSITATRNEYYVDDVLYVNNSEPIDVTFQVDMSFVETVAEPVNLVADFTEWAPVAMSDDGDGIWSITVSLDGDNTYLYNFINGATTDDAESGIEDCGVDSELGISRTLELGSETTVLDAVCYDQCADCITANFVDVSFAVDMSFVDDISSDGVFVIVDDNDPIEMTDEEEDGIYEVTAPVLKNDAHQYHFVNGSENETVPDDCGTDGRRDLLLADETVNLDIVCFSECTDCISANEIDVTFRVDLQNESEISADGVYLVGDFIGYDIEGGDAVPMTQFEDAIYEATVTLFKNSTYTFLYVNGGNTIFSESLAGEECGSEEGGRLLETPGESVVLETVCYSSCEACIVVAQYEVLFSVDMQFEDVSSDGVFLTGIEDDPIAMTEVSDDVYEVTVMLDENTTYTYAFANGDDVEDISGDCDDGGSRTVETSDSEMSVETTCFGFCKVCITSGIDNLSIDTKAFPNPTTGIVNISHAFDQNSELEVTVYNSIGQEVMNVKQISTGTLNLDLSELDNDVYFIEMTNGSQLSVQKLFKVD